MTTSSALRPYDAWTLAKIRAGRIVNSELACVSAEHKDFFTRLAALPAAEQSEAWVAHIEAIADRDAWVEAVAAADPDAPAPTVSSPVDHPPAGDDEAPIHVRRWPDPPTEAAFDGLAGDIVRAVEPHSEAAREAILTQILVGYGNIIGRSAFVVAEGDRHYTNEFVAEVGDTSKGRKGASWGRARTFLAAADGAWLASRVMGGLSSGEGLIHAVRDSREVPARDAKKQIIPGEFIVDDPGEPDKRVLCLESELGGTLQVLSREGNTLSALVRQAWDTGDLRTLTRTNPIRSTGAHVSIIGHITRAELERLLSRVEAANGFANRFLWIAVRRSKVLPFGGSLATSTVEGLAAKLADAANHAREMCEVKMNESARELWAAEYVKLSEGRPGLLGSVTSRAEAHTLRLALIYAMLAKSRAIGVSHLRSALALWDYFYCIPHSRSWFFNRGNTLRARCA